LEGDGFGAESLGQLDAAEGVVDSQLPLGGVILNPGGVIGVAAGEEGEGVDVADGDAELFQAIADALGAGLIHVLRVGVRHIGHQLYSAVADAGDGLDCLFEGVFLEGVGGEGEVDHGRELYGKSIAVTIRAMVLHEVNIPEAAVREFCRRHRISRLALFGSILRGDFAPSSDIDVLVEFEEGNVPGLDFFEMQEELSGLLGRKVDLHTPAFLSRYFRDDVRATAKVIYAHSG
jgi:predicted nucleotidyltransferase